MLIAIFIVDGVLAASVPWLEYQKWFSMLVPLAGLFQIRTGL
jgi:hypothetical protein